MIHAPIDGVVLKRLRESEAVVAAGEPLLEVADPAALEIVSDLLSTDAVKVRAGQNVLIEQWGGDHTLEGKVRRVEPSGFTKISALGVEEQRVNVIVDFQDPHAAWEALGDGFRVEIRIVVWERDDVLKVPVSSLFRQGDDWAVFAVGEGKARLGKVEVGQRNDLEAEVLSGLAEGEQVIVHPSDKVTDGVGVAAR
ncbi:MAG: efflux RND transporter periplasmic adaptor subunit [Thermoanaerobaculia bacterium]|nr:efflux RND transporter periplasmic adaptor subunit [Thermoanaerobaculia bacterium]